MLLVDNQEFTEASVNLALEDYCLKSLDFSQDYLLLYRNKPSIIVGKNQNVWEEVNLEFALKNQIPVRRRISGGGTVYHDLGNLNFAFFSAHQKAKVLNFKYFTKPIVEVLNEMGVPADWNARHDILVEGKKISGNAQYASRKGILTHGTLLFDANLAFLDAVIKKPDETIRSKSLKSVRSSVGNISDFLKEKMSIETFKNRLLNKLFESFDEIPKQKFTKNQWNEIQNLAKNQFETWEWNYGKSPKFNIHKKIPLKNQLLEIKAEIVGGKIHKMEFSDSTFQKLEEKLLNQIYDWQQIEKQLN